MPDTPAPQTEAWTVGRLIASTRTYLESRGVEDARLCAELLLAHVLSCRRIELYARFDAVPGDAQRAQYRELVRAAGEHRPIAYLVGVKEFYSLDFIVTPDVLIPRPETELLVERVLEACRACADAGVERPQVLDVGTGSGCVAITVCKRVPKAHVVATDISREALAVAAANAEKHGVAGRLRLCQADMLDLPADAVPGGGYDMVASNPPYVAETQRDTLPENVRKYEPAAALFGGPDGLDAFRRIAGSVRKVLKPGGRVMVEVGMNQADAAEEILVRQGGLAAAGRFRDMGGIERVIELTLPA